jgi:hypothetical protein
MAILRVLGKEELTSKLEAAIEEVSKCDAKGKSIEDLVTSLLALLQRLVEVDRLEDESEGESHVEGSSASTTSSPSTTSSLSSKGAPPKKGLKVDSRIRSMNACQQGSWQVPSHSMPCVWPPLDWMPGGI